MRETVGKEFPVSIKVNVSDFIKEGLAPKDATRLGQLLDQENLDLIEMSGGNYESLV